MARDIKGRIIDGSEGNTFSSDNQPEKRRGLSLVSKLTKLLKDDPERITKILEAVLKKAESGDLKAVEIILDRVDGKAVSRTDLNVMETKEGFQPIHISFID